MNKQLPTIAESAESLQKQLRAETDPKKRHRQADTNMVLQLDGVIIQGCIHAPVLLKQVLFACSYFP